MPDYSYKIEALERENRSLKSETRSIRDKIEHVERSTEQKINAKIRDFKMQLAYFAFCIANILIVLTIFFMLFWKH